MRGVRPLLEDWLTRGRGDEATPALAGARARGLVEAAEAALGGPGHGPRAEAATWHLWLDTTRRPAFLQALGSRELCRRWAEAAFAAIRRSRYGLGTLLAQRVREHPRRTLFQESPDPGSAGWSYQAVERRLSTTAAALLRGSRGRARVLILSPNGLDAACADLACLVHGIPVTPLNPETDDEGLRLVLERLRPGVILVGGEEQQARLERAGGPGRARLLLLDPSAPVRGAAFGRLAELASSMTPAQAARALESCPGLDPDAEATVMFTSGSTGLPKGVVHTGHAIVSKRFARAAALPGVGDGETLLCYLPLFHTFGRYLEMLGTLFWGGSYVFAGNPSFETLARGLPQVRPTGLVGIPRRWVQLRERCLAEAERGGELRAVLGDRLRWGLSAAGHLEPAVFRFFQRHGVELCSGFGMTEAAGGITMTPPGQYQDGSVGLPLPGIEARLSPKGELQIAGPYVGRYLDDPKAAAGEKHWLSTGDVFVCRPSGHFEIVDRVKDVFKNTRGQTVAPAAVERRLADVPGVRRSVLVGDGRDHNLLLIVPDRQDPVIAGAAPEAVDSYFAEIVAAVNREVIPVERVVSFALLERDLEPGRELTAKGSYRRKEIERSFAPLIERLYLGAAVEVACGGVRARLPHWLFRDQGLLETDVTGETGGLVDGRSGRRLALQPGEDGLVQVGDLQYDTGGEVVDLGLFARQPMLWAGNPALRAFAACKDGWDVPLGGVSPRVRRMPGVRLELGEQVAAARGGSLEEAHRLSATALFGEREQARAAVAAIAERLPDADPRLGPLLRRRLQALAWHPDIEVRGPAYRALLLDDPLPGSGELLASFVESGRPFLTAEGIDEIARARPEPSRLQSLRQRLHGYRRDLRWPASPQVRAVFEDIFDLLARTARERPEHLLPVRAELSTWALFDSDQALAGRARSQLQAVEASCRGRLAVVGGGGEPVLHGPLAPEEARALGHVLADPSFLAESVALAFDEPEARGVELGEAGAWVTPLVSGHGHRLYRVSFEDRGGHHRDLLFSLRGDVSDAHVEETMLWMIALGDPPDGGGVVPRFGCARRDLGVLSTAYVSGLSLWERVRAWVGPQEAALAPTPLDWQSLFVRGLAAFFAGWRTSDGRIVPGQVVPTNVDVPRADYLREARILSLAGWQRYQGPASLVVPMHRYFLEQAVGHYPALRDRLDPDWVYQAAVEGLGLEPARRFLGQLAEDGAEPPGGRGRLDAFRERLAREYHLPLALRGAVARYAEWRRRSPRATLAARRQLAAQMLHLYRLDDEGEIARYQLYRRTYFAEAAPSVAGTFDRLLLRMFERPGEPATRLVELSELQTALSKAEDRRAFGELVFPQAVPLQQAELRRPGGGERVFVESQVTDGRGTRFTVREPAGPAEVGRLYRLLCEAGLARGAASRQLVVLDREERVVGGILWRTAAPRVAHVEALVVAPALRSQRLAAALVEDFCARLTAAGYLAAHTPFGPEPLPFAPGFRVDRRWGGLVRFLGPAEPGEASS